MELTSSKFDSLIKGIDGVIKFDDPLNKVLNITEMDSNLKLHKITCPIGNQISLNLNY